MSRKYTVQVHLIEARGLVPRGKRDTTDSFCQITVLGRTEETEIQRSTVNCVWDQHFIFDNLMLTEDEFERENIYLQVFEANTLARNQIIGQYTFGMAKVNRQKEHTHQFYRTWVVLTDPNNPTEEQGFVRLTVTVLGPGDRPPTHESVAESKDDDAMDTILRPPTVRQRSYMLHMKVYRAEDLPVVASRCDPFVSIKFNAYVLRTPVIANDTKPVWNQHLRLPVQTPCMSDNVDIQLWDRSTVTPDTPIATYSMRFSALLSNSFGPAWINLYGPPVGRSGLWSWLPDVARFGSRGEPTAYLGRLLVALNCQMTDRPRPPDESSTPPVQEPRTQEYMLRVDVLSGREIGVGLAGKVMVEVTWGPEAVQSDWVAPDSDGRIQFTCSTADSAREPGAASACQFREMKQLLPIVKKNSEESKIRQIYDVIINVYTSSVTGVSLAGFLRYSAREVWGWNHKPAWHALRGIANSEGVVERCAGFLLFSVGFGPTTRSPRPPKRLPIEPPRSKQYELRAYVYQARRLTAMTEEGLTNAAVSVTAAGCTARLMEGKHATDQNYSDVRMGTLNPVWYQVLAIKNLELPEELSLAPDITLRVTHEESGMLGKNNDVVGRLDYPPALCTPDAWPSVRGPKWFRLTAESRDAASHEGDVLVRLELVPQAEAASLPITDHMWPQCVTCRVSMALVGLRNLEPTGMFFGDVEAPWMEIDVCQPPLSEEAVSEAEASESEGEGEEKAEEVGHVVRWSSKDHPDLSLFVGSNPNLLDSVHLDVNFPVTYPDQAPYMTVRVFDKRMLGKALVGCAILPLREHAQALYGAEAPGQEVVEEVPDALSPSAGAAGTSAASGKHAGAAAAGAAGAAGAAEEGEEVGYGGGIADEDDEPAGGAGGAGRGGAVVKRRAGPTVIPLDVMALNVEFDDEVNEVEEDVELEQVDTQAGGEGEVYWPGDMKEDEDSSRQMVTDELEADFRYRPPFREFPLFRGPREHAAGALSHAGTLKCAVAVARLPARAGADVEHSGEFLDLLRTLERMRAPVHVKVRVYVVKAHALIPRRWGGRADPYLFLRMRGRAGAVGAPGKVHTYSDESGVVENSLAPAFFRTFELDACFPDVPMLDVEVRDSALMLGGTIGGTLVDLENRWFNPAWQQAALHREIPKEFRTLWNASAGGVPQGKLEMWLEMYEAEQAVNIPFMPLEAPRPEPWELRVVVWTARKVPLVDGGKSVDIYVTCQLVTAEAEKGEQLFPGDDRFETDVHPSSKDGSGIFNYRMLFPMVLPCRLPRLKLQAWDQDLFSTNTYISEANVNLASFCREALENGERADRARTSIKLSHPSHPGEQRGEVDIQLTLVTRKYADKNPVGRAREAPNEDPFLPDVVRPSRFGFGGGGGGKGKYICMAVVALVVVAFLFVQFGM